MVNKENLFVAGLIIAVLVAGFALGDPSAPQTLTEGASSTFDPDNYGAQSVEALAGNVTALNIEGLSQTRAWQGYWGNISGYITLDDAQNNTFYNWSAAEPRGEVYATINNSETWSSVGCYAVAGANTTSIESFYGIDPNDADGIDETFTDTASVTVGTNLISNCNATYPFRDDAAQSSDFTNLLLAGTDNSWIYAAIIEDSTGAATDLTCFNGQDCDFQILVNEDGHGTDVTTTTYYFWVELS